MDKPNHNIITEQDQVHPRQELIDQFLEFCGEELGYSMPVEVNLVYDRDELATLASYNFRDYVVQVYAKDRALADILRSIAHELVHHQQNEEGRIDGTSPDIGGDIEDEANAIAGQLVKKFGYEYRNIYEQKYLEVSTISNEKTDRELCDDPEEGEFFCLAGSENLGTTDIYKDDGYNLIHQFSKPYHLSDVTPDEKETYHEPGAKKVKKTVLKPKLAAPFNISINEQDEQLNLFPLGEFEFVAHEDPNEAKWLEDTVSDSMIRLLFKKWDEEGVNFDLFKYMGIPTGSMPMTYILKRYIQNTRKPLPVSTTFGCEELAELFDQNNRDYDLTYVQEYLCGVDDFWDWENWYDYEWYDGMSDDLDEKNWKTISEIFGGVSQSDAYDILNRSSTSEEVDELIEKYEEEIDEIRIIVLQAHNDEHEYAIKRAMSDDIIDKIKDHFEGVGRLARDDSGRFSYIIKGDLKDYVNDVWDNTEDVFEYHPDYTSETLEGVLMDIDMRNYNPISFLFDLLMDEEYKFWDYCEGKKGDCLEVDTRILDGYYHPNYDINEAVADRLPELKLMYETKPLNEQEVEVKQSEEDNTPFTSVEVKIMNFIFKKFTLDELHQLATKDRTNIPAKLDREWKNTIKLFGEFPQEAYNSDKMWVRSTRFAKWIVDNVREATAHSEQFDEPVDFGVVTEPIKDWPSVYDVQGDEGGWEKIYKSGNIEIAAFDEEDAEERASNSWWDYDPEMDTIDYGDFETDGLEIEQVRWVQDIRESNGDNLSYRKLNEKDRNILNKISREYSLTEVKNILTKSEKEIHNLFDLKAFKVDNIKNHLHFISENVWPHKGDYTFFTGKIKTDILSEQSEGYPEEDEIDRTPFTKKEVAILKQLHGRLTREELGSLSEETPESYTGVGKKFWNVMKLFGITHQNDIVEDTRSSIYAKWAYDNWTEEGNYEDIQNPVKVPLKWYEIDRAETGSQVEYKDGTAEVLGFDEDDASDRADLDFYSWGGDMETTDYGDYETYDSQIDRADFIRLDEQEDLDLRTKALISIGGIQRDKVTTPKFIKNIFKTSGHEAKSAGIPEGQTDYDTFYTPGTNIDLNEDLKRIRDRIRFEEYGEMFQQGIEGRGFAFEGMLAGLFNGEPMEAGGKEDIKVGSDYYSIKQSNPGDAWDTGSLMKGFDFAVQNMVKDGFSEEEIPLTPIDLMVKGNDYIPYKAQMLTESFKSSNGQPLKWIFAHVLNDKQIEYEVLDSEELISAILSSDCSEGTRSQKCAVGRSRKGDTGVRIKSRFVLGDPKMITFPTVSEEDIKSIIYDPTGERVEDKIRRIFKDPHKVSQYTVEYIKNNPEEFKAAVNAILPTLTKEEKNIAYNLISEETDVFGQGLMDPIKPEDFEGDEEEWQKLVGDIEEPTDEDEIEYEYEGGKTDPTTGFVAPSKAVTTNICKVKGFCEAQGPITFGQLRELVKAASSKKLKADMGRGTFRELWRIVPFFIPQVLLAAVGAELARVINKIISPALKDAGSYKSWWGQVVMKTMNVAEGTTIPDIVIGNDPLSKVFFISDGLLHMISEKYRLKFAKYVAEVASNQPDDKPVPDWFVENLLRDYLNQKFLLDPPLPIKSDVSELNESLFPLNAQEQKKKDLTPQIFQVLDNSFDILPHPEGEIEHEGKKMGLYSHDFEFFVPFEDIYQPLTSMLERNLPQEDIDIFVNIITDWINYNMSHSTERLNEMDWKDEILSHEKNLSTHELKYKKIADNFNDKEVTIPVDIHDGAEPVIGTTDITFTIVRPFIFQGLRGDFFDNMTPVKGEYYDPTRPTVIKYDLIFRGVEPGSILEELLDENSLEGMHIHDISARERLMELLEEQSYSINEVLMKDYFKFYGITIGRLGNIYDHQKLGDPYQLPYPGSIMEHKQHNINPNLMIGDEITVVDVDKSYGTLNTPERFKDYVVTGIKHRQPENWESPMVDTRYYEITPIGETQEQRLGRMLAGGGMIKREQLHPTDSWVLRKGFMRGEHLTEDDSLNDLVYRDEPKDKHIRRMNKDLGSLDGFPLEKFKSMPPPENESDTTEEEIEYLDSIPVDEKFVESADDIDKHFKKFLNTKGLEFPKEELKKVLPGVRAIILKLKYHYNRPRPGQVADAKGMNFDPESLKSASTPSYPSGHAAQGRFIGRYLADLHPEYEIELRKIGEDIAYSRNMAKVHYPSDSEFGKFLGDEMYEYVYKSQPELEMELDEYCPMGKPNKCTLVNYDKLPNTLRESFVQHIISRPLTCEERELGPRP